MIVGGGRQKFHKGEMNDWSSAIRSTILTRLEPLHCILFAFFTRVFPSHGVNVCGEYDTLLGFRRSEDIAANYDRVLTDGLGL